jgi:hypothetical protein
MRPGRPVPPRAGVAITLTAAALLLAAAAGCGSGDASHAPTRATGAPAAGPVGRVTISAADMPACAQLYAKLQRVTMAISASSELIANSLNKQQLSQRIAAEQEQLSQSAELMGEGPTPAPLAAADRQLVTALRAFSADFALARGHAARGDFQAAVDAMGDKPVVQEIVDASTTIENACK